MKSILLIMEMVYQKMAYQNYSKILGNLKKMKIKIKAEQVLDFQFVNKS